ncbi:MAG TPA: hypothetical protein VNA24_02360 [Hyalangium sp.]|nr:hypothetical protein [Hyalangium sp.]
MEDAARGMKRSDTRLNRRKVLRWGVLHAVALVGGALFFSWSAVAVAAGLLAVTMCLGVSVGFHRGLIHRAFQTSRAVESVLAVLGTLAGLGGILGMSRMHHMRDHHQNQPDCPPYFGYQGSFLQAVRDRRDALLCIGVHIPPRRAESQHKGLHGLRVVCRLQSCSAPEHSPRATMRPILFLLLCLAAASVRAQPSALVRVSQFLVGQAAIARSVSGSKTKGF